jgi:hypothetical protein
VVEAAVLEVSGTDSGVLEIETVEGAALEVVATLETEILERGVPDTAEEDAVLGTALVEIPLL